MRFPTRFLHNSILCKLLIKNCFHFRAEDCLNGTLLKDTVLPKPFMNFTQFWKIYNNSKTAVDPTNKYVLLFMYSTYSE